MISRSLKNYSKDFFMYFTNINTCFLSFTSLVDKISCTFNNYKNVKFPFLPEIWSQFSKYQKLCESNLSELIAVLINLNFHCYLVRNKT